MLAEKVVIFGPFWISKNETANRLLRACLCNTLRAFSNIYDKSSLDQIAPDVAKGRQLDSRG